MPVASNAIAIPEGLDELDVLPRAGLSDLREHAATVSRQYSVFHGVQAEHVPLHNSCGIGILRQRKPLILRDHPGSAGLRNTRKVSNSGSLTRFHSYESWAWPSSRPNSNYRNYRPFSRYTLTPC